MTRADEVEIRCKPRRYRRVTLAECLRRYVDATALEQRQLLCCRCPDGERRRREIAGGMAYEDVR